MGHRGKRFYPYSTMPIYGMAQSSLSGPYLYQSLFLDYVLLNAMKRRRYKGAVSSLENILTSMFNVTVVTRSSYLLFTTGAFVGSGTLSTLLRTILSILSLPPQMTLLSLPCHRSQRHSTPSSIHDPNLVLSSPTLARPLTASHLTTLHWHPRIWRSALELDQHS